MAAETIEPETKRVKFASSVTTNANECITFNLLKKHNSDVVIENGASFKPEMTHQLFNDEEIQGYEGLSIDIYFTPAFQPLIEVAYASRSPLGYTNLKDPFTSAFPEGFFQSKAEFDKALEAEPPLRSSDMGACLSSSETVEGTTLAVMRSNLATAPALVQTLHARIEPLLLFFVDAASAIDSTDPAWEILFAVENAPDGTCHVVGFATLYKFWVFPDRHRIRLSQVLVLPPHQGRGIGTLLVEAAYKVVDEVNAVDITLEDPTEDMQRLRDRMDLQRILAAEWPQQTATAAIEAALGGCVDGKGKAKIDDSSGHGVSPLGASTKTLERLRKEFRLSRQQARRMWETLLFILAVPLGPQAVAAVEGFIQATLEAQVAGAKKESALKVTTDTEGQGFVMCKRGRKTPAVVPSMTPVEGISAEQQQAAILETVMDRIRELQRLILTGGEPEEEEGADDENDDE